MSKKDPLKRKDKDLPKIFLKALKQMLNEKMPEISNHGFGIIIEQNSKEGRRIDTNTINEFLSNETDSQISTLEKILLNDTVSDEALDVFMEKLKNLLKVYRKDQETVDGNADLEDAILGGSQGRAKLSKSGRIITPENFRRNKERMDEIGYEGEECMNAYLQKLKDEGKIGSFEWVSKQNATSPYDFSLSLEGDTKIFLDVKSTSGEFKRQIHISRSELELMSSDTERYDIYRIFYIDKNTRTAKLKIAEDVKSFAQGIIDVFKGLPQGVCADGISVDPSNSGLNFQPEIEMQLPDEPEEESEDIWDAVAVE